MKKTMISLMMVATTVAGTMYGADLFTENRTLKSELAEQQKQLQPLHQQNKDMAVKVEALKTTNDLVTDKISTPPKETVTKETVIWDYKLDSSTEYPGSPQKYAETVQDGEVSVLRITGAAGKSCMVCKRFSEEELAKVKGKKITCTVMVKGEKIEGRGKANFMISCGSYIGTDIGKGTFGWVQAKFTGDVPDNAKYCFMVLGLQGPTGIIYFKDLKITVAE